MRKPPPRVVWSWLALMVLLAATLGGAFLPIGRFNIALALAIAVAKGLIVVFVFMELTHGHTLRRLFAAAGLFWLIFLFGLSMTDYATRQGWPYAG